MQKQMFPLLSSSCPGSISFSKVYVGEERFLFRESSMWNSPRQNQIELCSNFIQSLVLPLISLGILGPEFRAGLWLSYHAGQDDRQTRHRHGSISLLDPCSRTAAGESKSSASTCHIHSDSSEGCLYRP